MNTDEKRKARDAAGRARILESRTIFRGSVFGVKRERVIEPGGVEVVREVVTHPGSVVVLPVLPDGRVVLIRQYRHSVGQYLWELVAGRIEPGENPLAAARRELLEETGYVARRFKKLFDVFPTPGFVDERMLVFVATGLRAGPARPEADERIQTKLFSRAELETMMKRGLLRDAKSVASLLYYHRFCLA